jgi:hypothetical protein
MSNFSAWIKFNDKNCLEGIGLPGVYLLAHLDSAKDSKSIAVAESSNVVYIGETTGQSLRTRLNQFSRSAFLRKNGHSGGWTYSDEFLSGITADKVPSNLYVAVMPVQLPPAESKAYIKYVERLAIWEYVKANGLYPTCNSA